MSSSSKAKDRLKRVDLFIAAKNTWQGTINTWPYSKVPPFVTGELDTESYKLINSNWHISTSRDPSKKKYNHKSLVVGLYHDKKSWFRPKIKKLILARSQNHAFSTLLRFQNNMLVRNLAITMHFLGVNGFLWMKSTS